jgi:hypothetical protein
LKEDSDVANKLKRIAIGLIALSMRLDAYAIQRGMTMDAAHPKDPDPKNWRTINGSKVHLTEGKIDGGAGGKFTGKEWTGKTKHEFTTKEKPKQEEPKSAVKPKAKKMAPAYVPKKMDEHAYTNLSSKCQQDIDDLASLAAYKQKKTDFDDPVLDFLKGKIKQKNNLDDKEMQGVKHAYEELQNGEIDKTTFKNTVASIAYYGVHVPLTPKPAVAPQPTVQPQIAAQPKPGQLQTKGLSKIKLTKATTGISTPKGTLGLYATEYESVIDPAFKNFEDQYGSVQTAKYTKQEKKSVLRYTQGSKHLRDYLCYGKVEGFGEYTKEAIQEKVDNISAGLAKMDHPDMWVCRKCTLMDWATKNNPNGATFEDLKKMKKDGEVFTNAAFLSSTPAEGGTYGDEELIRHFFVPKKAKGGYIKSVSSYADENEFLLDKGTKTRIMKVEKKDGKIITYEEVVLDDE